MSLLEVEGLSHRYPGAAHDTFCDVSFVLQKGEVLGLRGPSGCGKSTLLRVLMGVEEATAGTINLAPGLPEHPFAYQPQDHELFEWRTVLGNAALGLELGGVKKRQARKTVAEFVPIFGLSGFEDYYPRQLSGGMRQRTALMRTVALDRSVLLLDEPFSALDPTTKTELHQWFKTAAQDQKWTVILITHDDNEAQALSDVICEMTRH